MAKKTTKKCTCDNKLTDQKFKEELLYVGHLLKYNLYLLSKSVVLNSLLQNLPKKDGQVDISQAVNMTHGILSAFHTQDHPELAQQAQNKQPEQK